MLIPTFGLLKQAKKNWWFIITAFMFRLVTLQTGATDKKNCQNNPNQHNYSLKTTARQGSLLALRSRCLKCGRPLLCFPGVCKPQANSVGNSFGNVSMRTVCPSLNMTGAPCSRQKRGWCTGTSGKSVMNATVTLMSDTQQPEAPEGHHRWISSCTDLALSRLGTFSLHDQRQVAEPSNFAYICDPPLAKNLCCKHNMRGPKSLSGSFSL